MSCLNANIGIGTNVAGIGVGTKAALAGLGTYNATIALHCVVQSEVPVPVTGNPFFGWLFWFTYTA